MTRFFLVVALASLSVFSQALAPEPDDRFKADLLLIVAHPDDEGMAIGYWAKAVLDEHKRVAIVYATRGDGGSNAIGSEQGAALGAEREMEARRAVAPIGIKNVWFLGAPDTPGQNVFRSLETWNHGSVLWQVVRLVRLTRPQVIMTWLPAFSVGENHGDHQAASVIATEAFEMAADPTVFSEQLAGAQEGLQLWQPQKIYFFSDTANPPALDGKGPQYPWDEISASKHVSYGRIALESISTHRTQDYPGQMAEEALKKNDFSLVKQMKTRLVLGKSLVPGSTIGDVFEGTVGGPIEFKRTHGYEPELRSGLTAELGGPWAFYRQFWKAHGLPTVPDIFSPQMKASVSAQAVIPLLLHNDTGELATFDISANVRSAMSMEHYQVRSHESRTIEISVPTSSQVGVVQKVQMQVKGPNGKVADLAIDVTSVAKD